MPVAPTLSGAVYRKLLLFIAGMGGLLYGIDVGIIAAALLYLGRTVHLSQQQTSIIVAAVLGGSMLSSLVAGVLADWLGRRRLMIFSGFCFLASVGLIVLSQGFASLFVGRLLQGMSGGLIAVVVPLYLAECLPAASRGRGSAIFQLMLTVGIAIAAFVGWYYTQQAERIIHAAPGSAAVLFAASNHAWRSMFLAVVYPGAVFFLGAFLLGETPRWLYRKARPEKALAELLRVVDPAEARRQYDEMEELAHAASAGKQQGASGSLLQRRYVVPFFLACVILACNQATGINSILAYLVLILRQAGMSADHATQGDAAVKVLNVVMTLLAVALVDRKGRKFLLILGSSGMLVALVAAGLLFHSFEAKRVDLAPQLRQQVRDNRLVVPVQALSAADGSEPMSLSVLYSYGAGDKVVAARSTDADAVLRIVPEPSEKGTLVLQHAYWAPAPSERMGWGIAACLALFIAAFAAGPGVVVWLALSELMPTRIRSNGMGVGLLINQGISTLLAGVFLSVVGRYGYFTMFWLWAACAVVYLCTAIFFLPETKGKTLEEIEQSF
ncbi:MAG: MFS transporter [Acidobacteriaceae bacterium]|nr:MFS transporter [Acidobacteriaceae bacterium]